MPAEASGPRAFLPALTRPARITWGLAVLLIGIGILCLRTRSLSARWFHSLTRWALVPADPEPWTLLTAALLHTDPWHLVGNLVPLLVLGPALEARLGSRPYLLGLAAAAVLSHGAMVLAQPDLSTPVLGASSLVAAVAAAHLVLCRGQRWRPLVRLGLGRWPALPTRLLALALLLLYGVLWTGGVTGIAHVAHASGSAVGLLLGAWARSYAFR